MGLVRGVLFLSLGGSQDILMGGTDMGIFSGVRVCFAEGVDEEHGVELFM